MENIVSLIGEDQIAGRSLREYGSDYAGLPAREGTGIIPLSCYRNVIDGSRIFSGKDTVIREIRDKERLARSLHRHLSVPVIVKVHVPAEEIEAFLEEWPDTPGNLMQRLSGTPEMARAREA